MQMKRQRIINWLSQTHTAYDEPDFFDDFQPAQLHHPLSPPATQNTNLKRKHSMSQHSAKRQRVGSPDENLESEVDMNEMTPKARSNILQQYTLPSAESQSQSQSQASGRSSPSKQMDALELSGFKWNRQLSTDNPDIPNELFEFLEEMNNCYAGISIISEALKVKGSEILRWAIN
jgi:hypothetical protein